VVDSMMIVLTRSRLAAGQGCGCLTLSVIWNGRSIYPSERKIPHTKKLYNMKIVSRGRRLEIFIFSSQCRARRREGHQLQLQTIGVRSALSSSDSGPHLLKTFCFHRYATGTVGVHAELRHCSTQNLVSLIIAI
jgi:hypothetical protein